MEDKILFVGGTWDLQGGKESSLVKKFAQHLSNVTLYNGGHYNEIENILQSCKDYPIVFWWANIDNNLPKIRNVKEINYKTMLISSKRNDDNKYTFENLLQRSFELKSNLTIEFAKTGEVFNMRLFDPLGNLWYNGTNIKDCSYALTKRLNLIKKITRQSTVSDEENVGALAWFFNMFKQEMIASKDNPVVPIKQEFLEIVKNYATIFCEATFETKDVKRFLGNASFRCPKGFPSFRAGDYIFVSRRNVSKEHITIEDFVPVYLKDDKVFYCGQYKPSVDTPIQVQLYKKFKNINFMIHSHCYIKNAPCTSVSLPCGAIEEVEEIDLLIKNKFDGDYSKDFYIINLKGHGSLMMSKYSHQLKDIEIVGRHLPEIMY